MNSLAPSKTAAPLSESQKAALLVLLTDEDPSIYQVVRTKILSQGNAVRKWLRGHLLSDDPVLRRRTQEMVRYLDRQSADNRFLGFCLRHGNELDVEEACWMLAQTQYPDINVAAYRALLDNFVCDLVERIDFGAEPDNYLVDINRYLFNELAFTGNDQNYYDPENSYLNRVIDRRTGNPISLCLIYLLVARRLRLPVAGIGMPGHFLCRFQSTRQEIFIDAFNRGRLLTKAECVKYLIQSGHDYHEHFLAPINSRRILLRVCSNLRQIYVRLGQQEDSARLQRYIMALAK
jgi:regulator of sirC expression with transglutaminase-like and TPR domain